MDLRLLKKFTLGALRTAQAVSKEITAQTPSVIISGPDNFIFSFVKNIGSLLKARKDQMAYADNMERAVEKMGEWYVKQGLNRDKVYGVVIDPFAAVKE